MEEQLTPFSAEAFLDGVHNRPELPENKRQRRRKPRVSSITSCARQQAYELCNAPQSNPSKTDPLRRDGKVTAELGRLAEAFTIKTMTSVKSPLVSPEADGLAIRNSQVSLPDDAFVTGHPDGEIHQYKRGGTNEPTQYARELSDDLVWGFEHKMYGRYSYLKVFQDGLWRGAPALVAQFVLYGFFLGWDAGTAVILSQDASSMRSERNAAKRLGAAAKKVATKNRHAWALREDWNPKVLVYHLPKLKGFYDGLIPQFKARAEALGRVEVPGDVVREFDPGDSAPFPCLYCDFKDTCIADGPGTNPIPLSPLRE